MINIYLAAYKDYSDYQQLKVVCDKITSGMNKEDVTFFVTTGESGDNTCTKYAVENNFKTEDWFPDEKFSELKERTRKDGKYHEFYNELKRQKAKYIHKADHVILVSDYDAKNNGIGYAIRLAANNGKTISMLFPDKKELQVHKISNPNSTYIYKIENGSANFSKVVDKC